jgi:hypothetical protein
LGCCLHTHASPEASAFLKGGTKKLPPLFFIPNSTIVAIGCSFGYVSQQSNPNLILDMKTNWLPLIRAYDKRSNRHVVVLSADDESTDRVYNLITKLFPHATPTKISLSEFIDAFN